MPGKPKPEDILQIGADFDADSVIKGMETMGTGWGKQMHRIQKQSQTAMKGAGKDVKQFMWQIGGAKKAYKGLYDAQNREMRKYAGQVAAAQNKIKAAISGSLLEGGGSPINMKALEKELDTAKKKMESAYEGVADVKEEFTFDRESMTDAAKEAAGELWGPFESLLRKDLPGAIEKGGKLAGKGWEHLFKKGGHVFKWLGQAVGDKGGEGIVKTMKARWAAGGMGGKAGAVGGAVMGGLGKAMGGLLGVVSKLGPLLASVSTLITGIVQLFIDAEAAAKDFNNEIMSTTGNARFLSRGLGNADLAADDMKKTLAGMYADATDFSKNQKWGITKEQFVAASNAITAEGVDLQRLDAEYKKASGDVKSFGDLVRTSVGYSHAFGVSLQEIGQFSGEMMTELGMDVDQVESSFQFMLKGAEEAGIASNKFFGIIRGFSADLTLFTFRMEDVVKMMSKLGKAMSPRDAQKFMNTLTGMFKGTSILDNLKEVRMSGGGAKIGKMGVEGQTGHIEDLLKTIAKETGETINKDEFLAITKASQGVGGEKKLAKWIQKRQEFSDKKLSDETVRAINEAGVTLGEMQGTESDVAASLGHMDLLTKMTMQSAKTQKYLGVKLSELTGDARIKAEEALTQNNELQEEWHKVMVSLETSKASLVATITKNGDRTIEQLEKEGKISATDAATLKSMPGISGKTGAELAKAIDKMDATDLWKHMGRDQQKELEAANKEMDAQEKMAANTTSINTKIQILVDWLMRTFYQTVLGIWDSITDLPGLSNPLVKAQIAAARTGNKELADLAGSSKSIEEYQKKLADSAPVKEMMASLSKGTGKARDKGMDAVGKVIDALSKGTVNMVGLKKGATAAGIGGIEPGGKKNLAAAMERQQAKTQVLFTMQAAAQRAGSKEIAADLQKQIEATMSVRGVLTEAGFSSDEQAKVLQELAKAVSPEDMAKMAAMAEQSTTPGSIYVHDTHAEDAREALQESIDDQGATLTDIWKALRIRGIKLDKPFLENNIKKVFTDASYEAASEALMDYYMLSHAKFDDVVNAISKGVNPQTIGRGLTQGLVERAPVPRSYADEKVGIGVGGGAGGGGQVIELKLKGDLSRIIDARSQNVVNDHERMKTRR